MKYVGKSNEFFELTSINTLNAHQIQNTVSHELRLLWFQTDGNQLKIDGIDYTFDTNDILCLTEFNRMEIITVKKAKLLRWDKHFYCVITNDSEVGCKGILFYGATSLPIIHTTQQDIDTFTTVWKMLEQEMESHDNLQEEMLQMMLKRILILCTRMYKSKSDFSTLEKPNVDIVREYNFLVEQYFKEKHTVSEYAEILHKSPKTLSNLFKKAGNKSPLQFIQDRKMLEARRMLSYTDRTVSEIGYDLGFTDVQSFSRFFKKKEGISPVDFKNQPSVKKT